MKKIVIFLIVATLFTFSLTSFAKKNVNWSVCDSCSNPESVYYDVDSDILFVSNIDGEGDKKDGSGWISKLDTKGNTLSSKWITGLNAPKGMRSQNGILWVTDIDEVIAIDIKKGKKTKNIKIKDAKFLNDIAIGPNGTVYVSDTVGGKIYEIKGDKTSLFMGGDNLEAPNGLLYRDGKLYVAGWGKGLAKDWSTTTPGRIYYIDPATKKINYITEEPLGNLDGLEIDKDGNFLVSDWVTGKIYRVDKTGKSRLIYTGTKGVADLGYISKDGTIVFPEMLNNKITALN